MMALEGGGPGTVIGPGPSTGKNERLFCDRGVEGGLVGVRRFGVDSVAAGSGPIWPIGPVVEGGLDPGGMRVAVEV